MYDYFQKEVARLTEESKRIITAAQDREDGGMTPEERGKVEALIKQANDFKLRVQEMDDNARLLEAIDGVSTPVMGTPTDAPASAKSFGEAFVKSDGYRNLRARGLKGNWSTGPVEFGSKAELDDLVDETGSNVFGPGVNQVQPQIIPGIQGPVEQRLTVADMLGQGVTSTNAIVFLKETVTQNSAGVTAEGAEKPTSFLDFDKETASVEKIATFLPISDEMLEDEPQVASYINGRLQLFVRQAEEAYLVAAIVAVAGTSSSAGELGGDNIFDGIAAAIMHVRLDAGLEPDGLLVSPLDAARMDVARAVGGTGAYFSGGPYGAPSQNPWGLRRVVTTAVADAAPIVGAFLQGATVWRRGGLSVEASNSHADYFRRNLTALRCEERLALTIFRDAAFQVVDESSV